MRRRAPAITFIAALLLPIAVFAIRDTQARNQIDLQFRQCEANAYDKEIESQINAHKRYNDEYIRNLENYRAAIKAARLINDTRQSSQSVKDVERAQDRNLRDNKDHVDRDLKDARRAREDDRTVCRNTKTQQTKEIQTVETFLGDKCSSNTQCGNASLICSTTQGVCNRSCPTSGVCTAVCTGTCVRSGSTSSSIFINSSSSSSTSNNTSCQPYVCGDGFTFPSCSNGVPILYFTAPCSTNGGQVSP